MKWVLWKSYYVTIKLDYYDLLYVNTNRITMQWISCNDYHQRLLCERCVKLFTNVLRSFVRNMHVVHKLLDRFRMYFKIKTFWLNQVHRIHNDFGWSSLNSKLDSPIGDWWPEIKSVLKRKQLIWLYMQCILYNVYHDTYSLYGRQKVHSLSP